MLFQLSQSQQKTAQSSGVAAVVPKRHDDDAVCQWSVNNLVLPTGEAAVLNASLGVGELRLPCQRKLGQHAHIVVQS